MITLIIAITGAITGVLALILQYIEYKKSKVKLREVTEKIEMIHQYTTHTFFLSSLRLDKVISTMFKVSRQVASEAIRAGFVKVNHKEVEEVSFLCHNNDMISLFILSIGGHMCGGYI